MKWDGIPLRTMRGKAPLSVICVFRLERLDGVSLPTSDTVPLFPPNLQ
jgi:hypothetical protein